MRYVVQHNDGDGEFVDCVREDQIDEFDGDTRDLPPATFDTATDAAQFIETMCGLMHTGGDVNEFRVVTR